MMADTNSSPQPPEALPQEIARQIPEWRREHGDLLYIPVREGIIARYITRDELIEFELNLAADPVWAQIALLKRVTIHPDWKTLGDMISLRDFQAVFQSVWRASGFRSDTFDQDLQEMRMLVMEKDHAVIRHICAAFHCLPWTVNKLPRARILYLLAQAECVLGMTFEGHPIQEMQEDLGAAAQAREIKARRQRQLMGQEGPPVRTFNVEQDAKAAHRFETDVSDIDRPIER